MFRSRSSRIISAVAVNAAVVVGAIYSDYVFFTAAGLLAIFGYVILAAFAKDWVERADEDLEASRRRQNREKARTLG